ncbi:MAG: hypothetical protein ACFFD2_04235 [Promethearchaeota archaeon]
MTITLENKIAEDLIKFKLQSVQNTLSKILTNWNQDNTKDFIEKTRSGKLPEAEMDAITVRQLIIDLEKLKSLIKSIKWGKFKMHLISHLIEARRILLKALQSEII